MPADNVTPEIWFPNLGIYFETIPRVFISPFGFVIYWYAILIVTGIIAATVLGFWWAGRTKQNMDAYWDLLLIGLVLAFVACVHITSSSTGILCVGSRCGASPLAYATGAWPSTAASLAPSPPP